MQYLRHDLLSKIKLNTRLDWHDNEWKSSTHHLPFFDYHCMGYLSCNTAQTTIALHGIRACLSGILQSFQQEVIDGKEGNSMLWTWNILSICKISPAFVLILRHVFYRISRCLLYLETLRPQYTSHQLSSTPQESSSYSSICSFVVPAINATE